MASTYVDFTVKTGPTTSGDIFIQLDDAAAPLTVANFLGYATNKVVGAGYTDSFFHRLVSGFVLQGGGYDVTAADGVGAIATAGTVNSEYSATRPNVQYTVAMALVGTNVNSATDQFFINLVDNSANLDAQSFTVFGQVLPQSYAVVQQLAMLPVVNASAPFDTLPVEGAIMNGTVDPKTNLVEVTAVTVSASPPCYCAGTMILTDDGERPVETLAPGDHVVTASGASRPVKWIGRRHYAGRFANANRDLLPVRVAAGALGLGALGFAAPRRDLLLSPRHALLIDGVLVPAGLLVNGASITQADRVDEVAYFHVELETHDILVADGAPAESFVDDSGRTQFHNAAEYDALFPAEPAREVRYCAPRIESGPLLEQVRDAIDRRAGCARAA